MIDLELPDFNPVAAGQIALLQVPKYDLTLNQILLDFAGTTSFTKAGITTPIRVRKGTRQLMEFTGTELDAYSNYKQGFNNANQLLIDFNERDMTDIVSKEVGGYDMSQAPDPIFLEVPMPSGVTTPALKAIGFFSNPQGNPLVKKFVKVTQALPAGTPSFIWDPKGATVLRAMFRYAGTDWTPTANGNLSKVTVKKDGRTVFERTCLRNRLMQSHYRRTPQSRMFVVDKIEDGNLSSSLTTADAKSLEWQLSLTAADTVTGIFEVLDTPDNL